MVEKLPIRIAVIDCALEQPGHGGKADMGMRTDIHRLADIELGRAELVDEDERPDHGPLLGREHSADLEVAEVVGDGVMVWSMVMRFPRVRWP